MDIAILIESQATVENDRRINLKVPKKLVDPDSLVVNARNELEGRIKLHRVGEMLFPRHYEFYLKVTQKTMDRGLRVMDTFVKAMRIRGHDFRFDDRLSYILINGKEEMKMSLRELQKTTVTKQGSWNTTEYHPTGTLSLNFEHFGIAATIKDGRDKVEDQLSKIMAKLELLGERLKQDRLKNEEWHKNYKEQRRKEQETADRRRSENSAFQQLLTDSKHWNEALILRQYIDQVEQKAITNSNLTEDLKNWVSWARQKADWHDPLVPTFDEWLDDKDNDLPN